MLCRSYIYSWCQPLCEGTPCPTPLPLVVENYSHCPVKASSFLGVTIGRASLVSGSFVPTGGKALWSVSGTEYTAHLKSSCQDDPSCLHLSPLCVTVWKQYANPNSRNIYSYVTQGTGRRHRWLWQENTKFVKVTFLELWLKTRLYH